jgi:hypothetical protein
MVFRFGDALGATLFILLAALGPLLNLTTGTAVLLLSFVLVALALAVGAGYLKILRQSLETRARRSYAPDLQLGEGTSEEALFEALRSRRKEKIRFALHQLRVRLESEDNAEGRLAEVYNVEIVNSVAPLVSHPDRRIASSAMHLLVLYRPEEYLGELKRNCETSDIPDALCLFYMDRYLDDPTAMLDPDLVAQWVKKADGSQARVLTRLMAKSRRPEFLPILRYWMGHQNRLLAREAIIAVGGYRQTEEVFQLVKFLGENWSQKAARTALGSYGNDMVPYLVAVLGDPKVSIEIKREIPWILGSIDTSAATEGLVTSIYQPDPIVSYRALRGLNRIRKQNRLHFGEDTFLPVLQVWAREYYDLVNLEVLLGSRVDKVGRLLKKAVRERIEWGVEKMFRGLELFLPPGDAYFSYLGFTSNEQTLKENAIELIDLRIRGELRQTIQPIFRAHSRMEIVRTGRRLFGLSSNLEHVLADALFSADPLLRCCIITALKCQGLGHLKDRVEQATGDIHPVVRDTAEWALDTWGDPNCPSLPS